MFCCGMASNHIVGTDQITCGFGTASRHSLTISSPGKLNVFLEVLGKRADGYHELETVMLRTNLADQLTMRRNDSGTLSLRFSDATPEALRAGVPLDGCNLILKAAESIRRQFNQSPGGGFRSISSVTGRKFAT